MGDGIVKKIAVVINNGDEEWHLENVDASLNVLESPETETFVVSVQPPKKPHDHYISTAKKDVEALLTDLRQKIDDDDEVVFYITGHGAKFEKQSTICLNDDCDTFHLLQQLDQLSFGNRTVIMDQCLSGDLTALFADDQRSLILSLSHNNETDICPEFAPYFWSSEPGSWLARYQRAYPHVHSSTPKMVMTAGYKLNGTSSFSSTVEHFETGEELDSYSKLKPGELRIVYFSLKDCKPCIEYDPLYTKFAQDGGGIYHFVKTENTELSEKYGFKSWPSVMVIDAQGRQFTIHDKKHLFEEIAALYLTPAQRLEQIRKSLLQKDEIGLLFASFYARKLATELTPAEAAREAQALRELIVEYGQKIGTGEIDIDPERAGYMSYHLQRSYVAMTLQMEPEELIKEVQALSKLLKNLQQDSPLMGTFDDLARATLLHAVHEKVILDKKVPSENFIPQTREHFAASEKSELYRRNAMIGYARMIATFDVSPEEVHQGIHALSEVVTKTDNILLLEGAVLAAATLLPKVPQHDYNDLLSLALNIYNKTASENSFDPLTHDRAYELIKQLVKLMEQMPSEEKSAEVQLTLPKPPTPFFTYGISLNVRTKPISLTSFTVQDIGVRQSVSGRLSSLLPLHDLVDLGVKLEAGMAQDGTGKNVGEPTFDFSLSALFGHYGKGGFITADVGVGYYFGFQNEPFVTGSAEMGLHLIPHFAASFYGQVGVTFDRQEANGQFGLRFCITK